MAIQNVSYPELPLAGSGDSELKLHTSQGEGQGAPSSTDSGSKKGSKSRILSTSQPRAFVATAPSSTGGSTAATAPTGTGDANGAQGTNPTGNTPYDPSQDPQINRIVDEFMRLMVLLLAYQIAEEQIQTQAQSNMTQTSNALGASASAAAKKAADNLQKVEEELAKQRSEGLFGKIFGAIADGLLIIVGALTEQPELIALGVIMMAKDVMALAGGPDIDGMIESSCGTVGALFVQIAIAIVLTIATAGAASAYEAATMTTEATAKAAAQQAVKDSVKTAIQESIENAIKDAGEDATKESVKDAVKTGVKDAVEQAMKDATEAATKAVGKSVTKESVKEAIKEGVKAALEDSIKAAVKDGASASIKDAVEAGVEDAIDEAAETAGAAGASSADAATSQAQTLDAATSDEETTESTLSKMKKNFLDRLKANTLGGKITGGNALSTFSKMLLTTNFWPDLMTEFAKGCGASDDEAQMIGQIAGLAAGMIFAGGADMAAASENVSSLAKLKNALTDKGYNYAKMTMQMVAHASTLTGAGFNIAAGAEGLTEIAPLQRQMGKTQQLQAILQAALNQVQQMSSSLQSTFSGINQDYQQISQRWDDFLEPWSPKYIGHA